jgi:hypothetical protein
LFLRNTEKVCEKWVCCHKQTNGRKRLLSRMLTIFDPVRPTCQMLN